MTTKPETKKDDATHPTERIDGAPKPRPRRRQKPVCVAPGRQTGTPEARRSAAAVLEVLAGERRPREAAEALGVSVMRYYIVESRALQGLVDACEPRSGGRHVDPEKRVARLERQMDTLRRDTARYQALARAASRTLGVAPVKSSGTKKGGRKRRTPTVRALKAVAGFRAGAGEAAALPAQVVAKAIPHATTVS